MPRELTLLLAESVQTYGGGADIKTVQARLRHTSATTTLNTYGHLWPDADESTRAAIAAVINKRIGTTADQLRTESNLAR